MHPRDGAVPGQVEPGGRAERGELGRAQHGAEAGAAAYAGASVPRAGGWRRG